MEENIENKDSNEQNTESLGSGAMLAKARKELGKSAEEIATDLNLSVTQIKTIELDQSEGLPEATYVRGYIRSYANLVGLNPEDVLSHYLNKNWQKSTNLDDLPRGIADNERNDSNRFSPIRLLAFLVIAGVIGLIAYFSAFQSLFSTSSYTQSTADVNTTSEIDPTINAPNDVVLENIATESEDEGQINPNEGALESQPDTSETSGNNLENDQSTLSSASTVKDGQTTVVLSFTDTSWVDIRDESQNRLAYQSYPAGETLEVSAQGILSILLGNAKGVQMKLNGTEYDLSQHTEGVYAKFSVGKPKQ
ncbi:MAG: DUF4115 domain-containing protein [Gammaproteobacteria bacterium]|nr:DUF4115 domain-containing protein [Gammaproteobacteria bacterium]